MFVLKKGNFKDGKREGYGELVEVNGDIYKGIKYLLCLHYYEYKFILYIFNK